MKLHGRQPEAANGYRYDVFISYRRHPEWTSWTREHISTQLDAYLTAEIPSEPKIFVDEQIEPGADWPHRLGDSLARAKVLLVIFSGDYFRSEWCLHELDLMHSRWMRFPDSQLIIPAVAHDGDLIPIEIARLQPFDLKAFRNTDLQRRTPLYQQLSERMKELAPAIATAINTAPPFDDKWVSECRSRFDGVYSAHCGRGPAMLVETLTLKPLKDINSVPRVML